MSQTRDFSPETEKAQLYFERPVPFLETTLAGEELQLILNPGHQRLDSHSCGSLVTSSHLS